MEDEGKKDVLKAPRRKPSAKAQQKQAALEKQLAEQKAEMDKLRETVAKQAELQTVILANTISNQNHQRVPAGQQVVGIRNVSNYTVGLVDRTGAVPVEYSLYPPNDKYPVPQANAVIPYAFWQQLRYGKQYKNGLIVRDDSILAAHDVPGPEDPPEVVGLAKDNVVENAREWILSHSEEELRAAIESMTSTATLRKLARAVDVEIFDIGEEKFKGDEQRAEKAISALPAVFRLVEDLAQRRLSALTPAVKDPSFMTTRH